VCWIKHPRIFTQANIEQAEATEFTTTLLLLPIFIIAGLCRIFLAIKNRGDVGLVALVLITIAFAFTSNYSGSWNWKLRMGMQLSYALMVLSLGTIRLLAVSRQPS
jgi:hypothetical protein